MLNRGCCGYGDEGLQESVAVADLRETLLLLKGGLRRELENDYVVSWRKVIPM